MDEIVIKRLWAKNIIRDGKGRMWDIGGIACDITRRKVSGWLKKHRKNGSEIHIPTFGEPTVCDPMTCWGNHGVSSKDCKKVKGLA